MRVLSVLLVFSVMSSSVLCSSRSLAEVLLSPTLDDLSEPTDFEIDESLDLVFLNRSRSLAEVLLNPTLDDLSEPTEE